MKRWFLALVALLLASTPARAQIDLGSASITAASSGSACTAVRAGCAEFFLPNASISSITLQVTGTFSQTLAFEGTSSADPATGTWFSLSVTKLSDGSYVTSTTATGQFSIPNSGLTGVRLRCTSFVSGTAVVAAVRGYAFARTLTPFFSTGYFGDGTAAAPSIAFGAATGVGLFRQTTAASVALTASGSQVFLTSDPNLGTRAVVPSLGWTATSNMVATPASDVMLERDAANTLTCRNSTNACTYRVENTFTSLTNRETLDIGWSGNVAHLFTATGSAGGTSRGLSVGGDTLTLATGSVASGAAPTSRWVVGATGDLVAQSGSGPAVTQGSGTGVTVNSQGSVRDVVYKVTVDRTQFVAAAVTADFTIATLPAKTQVIGVMADLTQTFACTATCTSSTLSFVLGRGAGGAQFLASFDADAATGQFGDADAELGTTMTRAAAIQGGSFESWSSTQAVVLRLTSGTGNIGNGSATNLSQGSVTIYLVTRVFP